jgi:hypothetical protein
VDIYKCLDEDWTRTVYFQFFSSYHITVVCEDCPVADEPYTWSLIKSLYEK